MMVNQAAKVDRYPHIPLIDDLFAQVGGGGKLFTT